MGSHYIPVGKIKIDKEILDIACPAAGYGETPPPPEIYCPAEGYIPDPSIYHEDPIITEAPRPAEGQIRLIATDSGSRHIQFKCQVSNTGKYVVTVIGADNTVIETKTQNNNSVCQVFVPLLEGFLTDNYSYYYIDIAPELETNDITLFQTTINNTYDTMGGYIIAAYFNTPEITSLYQAFRLNKRITYAEIISADNLTTLEQFAYGANNFTRFILPDSLPELTTMSNMCYQCMNNYLHIKWPTYLPKLITMGGIFNQSKIKTFTFLGEFPLLENLSFAFYDSEIEEIKFNCSEFPELTTIANFANACKKLKGKIKYPEMPKLTTMEAVHLNNSEINEIKFVGAMDELTTWNNLAVNNYKLKKLTLPESVLGFTNISNTINVVDNCNSLEILVMPKKMKLNNNDGNLINFFNNLSGCVKLHTITKIEEANNAQWGRLFSGSSLINLKSFDQPELMLWRKGTVSFTPATGLQGALEYFNINWGLYDEYNNIDLKYQNLPISEIRRILNTHVHKNKFFGFYTFNCRYNPSYEPYRIDIPSNIISVNKYVGTITKPNWDDRIKIGHCAIGIQSNSTANFYIVDSSTFRIGSQYRAAPKNDTKCITIFDTYESYGLERFKTYYIVNSDEENGLEFQLSETKGGVAINFGFGIELIDELVSCKASNYVLNIIENPTTYEVHFSYPWVNSSGTRNIFLMDSDVIDFWEFYERGFIPA